MSTAGPDPRWDPDARPPAANYRRRLRLVRWPALILGLLLIGSAATYLVAPPVTGDAPLALVDREFDGDTGGNHQVMPSVVGLDRHIARSVLADAGLSDTPVAIDDYAAAGPVGLVLEQHPEPNSNPGQEIRLVVSTPIPVPAVVGKPVAEARDALETLGAVVRVVPAIRPEIPRGQVLSIAPAEGAPTPTVVTVTVADPGDALTLATVESVEQSSCSTTDQVSVNGAVVGPSIECSTGSDVAYIEYALARNAVALEALVGTNDREGTGGAEILLLGDGRELARLGTGLGQSHQVRTDLQGVLRLRIEAHTGQDGEAPAVVLGDARLLGSTEGLNAIAGAE
ncbi:PASTA domain-containing protein [Rhodococcus sp. M8-35]|uniref:PASTA domain-containing protein n=1 Tax=Rhodococcus sp. M8-35 TaxID=3058401 RepID=UPI002ED0AAC7